MKKLLIIGLLAGFIFSSCAPQGRNCKGAKQKWGYYNSLQFGKAPSKTLKKKR